MNLSHRAVRLTAQISLLVALLATSVFLVLRTYIGDEETVYKAGNVNEVVHQGPVTIGNVEWKLESLQPWTQLVDEEKEKISITAPTRFGDHGGPGRDHAQGRLADELDRIHLLGLAPGRPRQPLEGPERVRVPAAHVLR